ncbi:TIGR04283 family arsenosugar biosynthesis glycosyltransferase [Kamptonema formosum]|uniref:TIGR04283 family arsenosugar biosynthesis glycosyltransferase n=1 Tax=Kamptonema formosum TaxID=331992 RepID=UPI0005C701F1
MESARTGRECLIVFTRYPEPGLAKTRLMPALGAQGAAELHRHLAEHTLTQARELQASRSVSVEVWFAGGGEALMRDWLGDETVCRHQREGDLGARMSGAFEEAFSNGAERAAIIGTDCPDLDARVLGTAFEQLLTSDLVLGPAADGGYYLIGLRRFVPELLTGITWGTGLVLQQTAAKADRLNLTTSKLQQLADIDRPEDLAILENRAQIIFPPDKKSSPSPSPSSEGGALSCAALGCWGGNAKALISIIVPALNEAGAIQKTLELAKLADSVEVIVADGGSEDETVGVSQSAGVRVISAPKGRARQMNAGAAAATGDILLFLHADTHLPQGFDEIVRQALATPGAIAGAFELRIDSPQPVLRLVEIGVNWRSRLFQMPYGDQAIFLPAPVFRSCSGFPDTAIMEDFQLMLQLRRLGKINIVAMPVVTSGRRWQKLGVLKTTLINQLVIVAYFLGVPPERLARWYRREGGSCAAR